MKRTFLYFSVALLVLASCAKTPETDTKALSKAYFDAWMMVNHPDLQPTRYGAYVIEETEGSGEAVGTSEDNRYVRVHYTTSNLQGKIVSTTSESVSQQIGSYSETSSYLPVIWDRNANFYAGIDEALSTMRIGGKKKTIIPGWLFTPDRYDTAREYVDNSSSTANNAIYEIEVVDAFKDVVKWEIDSLSGFVADNYQIAAKDSLKYGYYYKQRKAPTTDAAFKNDTTIYINYTGRLLNGKVFDTTIADTAKFYGIYSSDRDYAPAVIKWNADDYTQITLSTDANSTGSNVVDGFAYTLKQMKAFEQGTGIFYSSLGYGSSGSGNIPAYSPLIFDIEIVAKPE